jgi:hypothetical protein
MATNTRFISLCFTFAAAAAFTVPIHTNERKIHVLGHALHRPLFWSKPIHLCRVQHPIGLKMAETTLESLVDKVKSTSIITKIPDRLFKALKKASGAPTVLEHSNIMVIGA